MTLRDEVLALVDAGASADKDAARSMFEKLRAALSAGEVRAAEPDASSPLGWVVNTRTLAAPGVMLKVMLVAPVRPALEAVSV